MSTTTSTENAGGMPICRLCEKPTSTFYVNINGELYHHDCGDIARSFSFHNRLDKQVASCLPRIREAFLSAAKFVLENCPAGRERAVAITKLEEASMWAVKSVVLGFPLSD